MITQAEAGLSVCGIQGNGTHKKCLFSLRLDEEGADRGKKRFDDAFVTKKKRKEKREKQEFPGFSSLLLLQCASGSAQDDWSRKRESMVRVPIAQI